MRILFFIVLILATSCQPNEIMLTNLEHELIDSLSRIRSEEMKQEIEDSCKVYKMRVFDQLVDSIKRARLEDIHRLLEAK